MVALIVGSRARIVLANPGETSRYSSLMRSMNPAIGLGLKGIPFCLRSVTRVYVREAIIGGSKTSEVVHLEGSGEEGMSGIYGSKWQLSFEVRDVLDI